MKAATGIDIEKRLQDIADMPDDQRPAAASKPAAPPVTPEAEDASEEI
jgi:hypothetical protein